MYVSHWVILACGMGVLCVETGMIQANFVSCSIVGAVTHAALGVGRKKVEIACSVIIFGKLLGFGALHFRPLAKKRNFYLESARWWT